MGGIMSVVKSLLGICETKPLDHNSWSFARDRIRVKLSDMSELCPQGEGVYLKGQGLKRPILLVRTDDDQYLAFTNRCTHIGHRKLDPVPGQSILRCCSVNHSTFDYNGNRLSGPAKNPLTRHDVQISGGEIFITV